jgi:two-component system chemotaxis response regulator CheB
VTVARIRALVVEDSLTVRRRIVEVLAANPELEVVGEAGDGKRAIELCGERRPDVVTLDMMLPVMTGLAATEYIMAYFPTPILIVSASTNRGELFRTYEALAAGALDVLEKPTGAEPDGDWERRLVAAVKLVSRIKVITHPRARLAALARRVAAPSVAPFAVQGDRLPDAGGASEARACRAIAIGASTGGPAAIVDVLRPLPAGFAVPIFLVIHIGEPFGTAFADWLDGQTEQRVAYARDDQPVASLRGVTMAPPERHLLVRGGRLRLVGDPPRHSCRPSVDVLFESVASEYGRAGAGCLLTGMGRDGAAGLLEIRRAGGRTLAQDEATSVVYGMPREAVLLGAAERVLPLGDIGAALAGLGSGGEAGGP